MNGNTTDGEADYADIRNYGDITTNGNYAIGIYVYGDDAYVLNAGNSITTFGDRAHGIYLNGDRELGFGGDYIGHVVNNTGAITTSGFATFGILLRDTNDNPFADYSSDFGIITNSGPITVTGNLGTGIGIAGSNGTVTNTATGVITVTGDFFSAGIGLAGDQHVVSNAGGIYASGDTARGINLFGDNQNVTNSGIVDVSGPTSIGVRLVTTATGYSYITNTATGTITGDGLGSYAIHTTDGDEFIRNAGILNGYSYFGDGDDEFTFVDLSTENGANQAHYGIDLLRAEVNTGVNRTQYADTFYSDFLGFEYFEKTGAGTLTIDGDLYFDGSVTAGNGPDVPADIINGTLNVLGGSFFDIGTATMIVRGPATIAGNGTIIAGLVDVYGTISPGASIGTLTIDGDLLLEATSHLAIEIDPLNNTADQVVVTGNVHVWGGTIDAIFLNTPQAAHTDIIVDDQGTLTDDAPMIAANPFSKFLSITVEEGVGGFIRFNQATIEVVDGLTVNQNQTADYLNALSAVDGMSGDTLDAFAAIAISADGSQPAYLQQLHPEAAAGATAAAFGQAQAVRSSVAARADRVARGEPRQAFWIDAIASFSDNDGDDATGFSGFDSDFIGFIAGGDFIANENLVVGGMVSYISGDADFDDLNADLDFDGFSFGAYGNYRGQNWRASGSAQYGMLNQDLVRMPGSPAVAPFGAVSEVATSSPDTDFFSVAATFFYSPDTSGTWGYEPFAGFAFTTVDRDGDVEAGAPVLGLNIDGEQDESLLLSVGVRAAGDYQSNGAHTVPHVSAGVSFEVLDRDRMVTSQLSTVGGASTFTVFGARPDSLTFDLGAGVQHTMSNGFSFGIDYRGQIGGDTLSHLIRIGGQKEL